MSAEPEEDFTDADEVKDPPPETALELRRPSVPATLDQIAALGSEGIKIIQARVSILETLKAASISMTHPEDWLLFRDAEGNVKCYLMDAGCDRISALWGIEIFNIGEPSRLAAADGSYCWSVTGDGRCAITGQIVEKIEGMRASTDDIAKNLKGAKQEFVVRKSARANLDGSILRELSGFKNVPLNVLEKAIPDRDWLGRGAKGKGFGSGSTRQQEREGDIDLSSPVPKCPKCGGEMWDNRRDKKNPKAPDFKCKKRDSDPNCDGALWQDSKKPAAPAPPPQQTPVPPPSPASVPPPASAPPQQIAPQAGPGPTAAPSGGSNPSEEETRLRRVIRSQFKGLHWNLDKQRTLIAEYLEAANLPTTGSLDDLKIDSLREIHEDLKKGESD